MAQHDIDNNDIDESYTVVASDFKERETHAGNRGT